MTEVRVLARRGRDRKDIMWCVESEDDVGMSKTQRLIDISRDNSEVTRAGLDRWGWDDVAVRCDDDYAPISADRTKTDDGALYHLPRGER